MSSYTVMVLGCPARRRGEAHNWRAMNTGTTDSTAWVYCVECGTTKLGADDEAAAKAEREERDG